MLPRSRQDESVGGLVSSQHRTRKLSLLTAHKTCLRNKVILYLPSALRANHLFYPAHRAFPAGQPKEIRSI
jgi:hypothetical protein